MVWDPPTGREIFDLNTIDVMERFRADQDWIGHVLPDAATMPPEWFAKARQCRDGVPPDVRLVLAHRVDLIGRTLAEVAA